MQTRTARQKLRQGAAVGLLLLFGLAALPTVQASGRHLQQQERSGAPTAAGGAPTNSLQRFLNALLAQLSARPSAAAPSPQDSPPAAASGPVPGVATPAPPGLVVTPEVPTQPQQQQPAAGPQPPAAPTGAADASDAAGSTSDDGGDIPVMVTSGLPTGGCSPFQCPPRLACCRHWACRDRVCCVTTRVLPATMTTARCSAPLQRRPPPRPYPCAAWHATCSSEPAAPGAE